MAHQLQQQGNVTGPAPQLGPQTVVLPYYGAPQPIKYKSVAAKVLGSVQIIIGVACIIFNGVAIALTTLILSIISYGIWGGAIFFVAGLLQVLSGRNPPSKCLIISTMVMSIIAACATPFVISLSLTAATMGPVYFNSHGETGPRLSNKNHIGLNCAIAVLSFIEAVVAITSSALCCKAVCCCGANSYNGNPVYVHENQQVMQIPAYPGYAVGMTPASQLYVSPTLYPTLQQYPTALRYEEVSGKAHEQLPSEIKEPRGGY